MTSVLVNDVLKINVLCALYTCQQENTDTTVQKFRVTLLIIYLYFFYIIFS